MIYQCVKIPTSLNITHVVVAESLEAVQKWAKSNLDTSTRWIVRLDGKNIGEALHFDMYSCTYSNEPVKSKHNFKPKHKHYFETKAEALRARNGSRAEATKRLDEAEKALNGVLSAQGVTLSYHMDGDTHGIHEDYQYLEVTVNGYSFERRLDR